MSATDEFAVLPAATAERRAISATDEARRQMEICNACRYCEGYCDVFQAMTARRSFAAADLGYLANLCHNCRGCYYACQYTAPHEFDLNLPRALADLRQESWQDHAWPRIFARAFRANGVVISLTIALGVAAILMLSGEGSAGGGFYAVIPHETMVAVFAPVFLFALLAMGIGAWRFWRAIGAAPPAAIDLAPGLRDGLTLKNLSGGHGAGCNYEQAEVYTPARRQAHHLTVLGFALCSASTSAGTVLHYGFDMPAPYGFWSLPKLFGMPGGVLLCMGTAWLLWLKRRADRGLGAEGVWGGEVAFILLLFLVSLSGLALYAFRGTGALTPLLALHLGLVLAFFATMPYAKMVHGAYRLAALIRRAQERRLTKG
ncbi:MAG: tricarballylate utilization 4Fe-4S protein TcuB [Pseudomonadota bacterium]